MASETAKRYYYVFTAKGLQGYIFGSDKLRLMVGASELIESIPSLLQGLLEKLCGVERSAEKGSPGNVASLFQGLFGKSGGVERSDGKDSAEEFRVLSSAAGGFRVLLSSEELGRKLVRLVPPTLAVYAPGLPFVQTLLEVKDGLATTMERAEALLQVRRNVLFPDLPVPGPLVKRAPRSGLAVVGRFKGEEADAAMVAKNATVSRAKEGLALRVLPPEGLREETGVRSPRYALPDDFSHLTRGERSTIGIVHIDGNGLGGTVLRVFQELKRLQETEGDEKVAEKYRNFSAAVAEAGRKAVQKALTFLVEKVNKEETEGRDVRYPFRPLVCAGDDVTVVLPAEHAFRFAKEFLEAFERTSGEALQSDKVGLSVLKGASLTACAGIAYVKKSFPFAQGYDLAESLCAFAKKRTERKCSAIAFWRVTTTVANEFEEILERELTVSGRGDGERALRLTMMPYAVGGKVAAPGLSAPKAEALLDLAEAVKAMPRGGLRGVLTELYRSRSRAERMFERLCDVAKDRAGGGRSRTGALEAALRAVGESVPSAPSGSREKEKKNETEKLFFSRGDLFVTPLHDAVELLSAER